MEVETERLILRPLAIGDLDELVALQAEPEVARFMGAYGRAELTVWVRSNLEEWARRGHGRMAILERDGGRLIGRTGLRHWPQFGETELGWALSADARGHGYATEAARACLAWGFGALELDYITAMIRPENTRSIAVAERLGMRPLRPDVLLGEPVTVYAADQGSTEARVRPTSSAPK
jgi:RimJ/RimL family protein N-acetyltransferase